MITLQVETASGSLATNSDYFPKDWKEKGRYRFVATHPHGGVFCSDGLHDSKDLMSDPLWVCRTSSDEYKKAADKRIFG